MDVEDDLRHAVLHEPTNTIYITFYFNKGIYTAKLPEIQVTNGNPANLPVVSTALFLYIEGWRFCGVHIDDNNRLFSCDRENGRIGVWDLNHAGMENPEPLVTLVKPPSILSFNPTCATVIKRQSRADLLIVVDYRNDVVYQCDLNVGTTGSVSTLCVRKVCAKTGSALGQVRSPCEVKSIPNTGDFVLADWKNNRAQVAFVFSFLYLFLLLTLTF